MLYMFVFLWFCNLISFYCVHALNCTSVQMLIAKPDSKNETCATSISWCNEGLKCHSIE